MIYIVRHGQTDWNVKGIMQGRTDIPLNEVGINQALETKEKLKDINFDKVFSSPLKRAYETAKIITNKDIIIDERLIERGNGLLEGKSKNEFPKDLDFNNDKQCTKYEIELLENIHNRIQNFFSYLEENYKNKNILIVTHAGTILNIRCILEGEPEDGDISKYKVNNCEVIIYNN